MKSLFLTNLLATSAIFLTSFTSPVISQEFTQSNSPTINISDIAKTTQESYIVNNVKEIAEKITVRIDFPGGNGSGTIIAHQGNKYYVLTAAHVVNREKEYTIVTPDGETYNVDYNTVKKLEDIDLAVVQFQSKKVYQIATLVDYGDQESIANQTEYVRNRYQEKTKRLTRVIVEGERIQEYLINPSLAFLNSGEKNVDLYLSPYWSFLYGWQRKEGYSQPYFSIGKYYSSKLGKNILTSNFHNFDHAMNSIETETSSIPKFFGDIGKTVFLGFSAVFNQDIFTYNNHEYEVMYTSASFGGMSGGPVLDIDGRVAAIHTTAEGVRHKFDQMQLGYSAGVLTGTFLRLVNQLEIEPQWLNITKPLLSITTLEEDDSIIKTLLDVTPPQDDSNGRDWLNHGNYLWRTLRYEQAVAALDRAIKLEPDLADDAYYLKGRVLESLANKVVRGSYSELPISSQQREIEQYNQKNSSIFSKRYFELKIEAYNAYKRATELNPKFYQAWKELGDMGSSIATAKSPLQEIVQELQDASDVEGTLLYFENMIKFQDLQKSSINQMMRAYDRAISIKPENSFLHSKKAVGLFFGLGSGGCLAAIDSINEAIGISPHVGQYYRQRAIIYLFLRELDKAETDYNHYRKLDPISYNDDVLKSIFFDRNSLAQWVKDFESKRAQWLYILSLANQSYRQLLYELQEQKLSENQKQRLFALINNNHIDIIGFGSVEYCSPS